MAVPTSHKQWFITGADKGFDGLVFQDAAVPKIGENEILVKMGGASINYRDLIIPKVWGLLVASVPLLGQY